MYFLIRKNENLPVDPVGKSPLATSIEKSPSNGQYMG
jgi:hypothetical protein